MKLQQNLIEYWQLLRIKRNCTTLSTAQAPRSLSPGLWLCTPLLLTAECYFSCVFSSSAPLPVSHYLSKEGKLREVRSDDHDLVFKTEPWLVHFVLLVRSEKSWSKEKVKTTVLNLVLSFFNVQFLFSKLYSTRLVTKWNTNILFSSIYLVLTSLRPKSKSKPKKL